MINTDLFKEQRPYFVETLERIDPHNVSRAKGIYDFLISACDKYNDEVRGDLKKSFRPLDSLNSELIRNYETIKQTLEGIKNGNLESIENLEMQMGGIENIIHKYSSLPKEIEPHILNIKKKHGHHPAYIIVAGIGKYPQFNYFENIGKVNTQGDVIGKSFFDKSIEQKLFDIGKEDGAILLDTEGKIIGYNAIIRLKTDKLNGLSIKDSLNKEIYTESMREGYGPDNPRYYGFRQDVNARHDISLAASFIMPGTVVTSLGEPQLVENKEGKQIIQPGHIRRYQYGLITGTTYEKEIETVEKNIKRIESPGFRERITNLFMW